MTHSMTAYATRSGAHGPFAWTWEVRSVNGKGLDLRLRVPDWIAGLEPAVRGALTAGLARGNVQVALRIQRDESQDDSALDEAAITRVLADIKRIEAMAAQASVPLAPARALDILTMRQLSAAAPDDGGPALAAAVKADIAPLIAAVQEMRAAEGAALHTVLTGQLDQIDALVSAAAGLLPARAEAQRAAVVDGLARLTADAASLDPGKMEQEIAQILIKADITEEIDRLRAHVAAARDLLAADGPVGRKFDFLAQEFNREANTLCAKSGNAELTRIGLDLKVAVDQMREQIQNVE